MYQALSENTDSHPCTDSQSQNSASLDSMESRAPSILWNSSTRGHHGFHWVHAGYGIDAFYGSHGSTDPLYQILLGRAIRGSSMYPLVSQTSSSNSTSCYSRSLEFRITGNSLWIPRFHGFHGFHGCVLFIIGYVNVTTLIVRENSSTPIVYFGDAVRRCR